mmetsp:Transcript_53995/g.63123  ORF Transcript_53995/g.63123 Transcript_53995/m.63123 type:complete len:121 (-) Transcript_53995:343-705(-)
MLGEQRGDIKFERIQIRHVQHDISTLLPNHPNDNCASNVKLLTNHNMWKKMSLQERVNVHLTMRMLNSCHFNSSRSSCRASIFPIITLFSSLRRHVSPSFSSTSLAISVCWFFQQISSYH